MRIVVKGSYAYIYRARDDPYIRVDINELKRNSKFCSRVIGFASPQTEKEANEFVMEHRGEIIAVVDKCKNVERKIPEELVKRIKQCNHVWARVYDGYNIMRCTVCNLEGVVYMCRKCKKDVPFIFSQYLGAAGIHGDITFTGELEQWVCSNCCYPKTVRKGGSFARTG